MKSDTFIIGEKTDGLPAVAKCVKAGFDEPLFLISGPCVIESRDLCLSLAERLLAVCEKLSIGLIFKGSFDKANRSSISSYRGPGIEKGLEILSEVRKQFDIPVMTDVHETSQVKQVAQAVDCLQIPAFLCRQTDLLCACASTGKCVNIKKGQFLSPDEMQNAVEKVRNCGNNRILLTERGTSFGYNRLINDMAGIRIMQNMGCPVVFDATHSTQQPGGLGKSSGGQRDLAPILARSAIAAGANGLFLEVHIDPEKAKSDAACVIPIESVEKNLLVCKEIFEIVRKK